MAVTFHHSRTAVAILLGVLTALYATLIGLQIGRHLWFDELLTYHISQATPLSRLLYLVKKWDLNPPQLHVLAHASLRLTHGNPIAIRFPSVLEFYAASLLLFWYAARKVDWAFAVLPVLILWYSPMFQYATEARPYAALCCWFCALLVFWDIATSQPNNPRRRYILGGVSLSSVGLMSSHVFAPLSLLAFFVAECVRFRRNRRTDLPLWAALFLPLALVFFYLPFLQSYGTITDYPIAFQAGLDKIVSFYWHTFLGVLPCVLVALVAGFLALRSWKVPRRNWAWLLHLRPDERTFFVVMALIPVLLDMLMLAEQSPFWGRYGITSVIALYLVVALVLATVFGRSRRAAYAATVSVLALLLIQQVVLPLKMHLTRPEPVDVARFKQIRPELPIVAASGLTFVEMGQYESPELRARLYYLRDRSAAIQFAHATIFEDLGDFQREFQLPGTVEEYRRFTREHPDFLVFGTISYPEDWLLRKLIADGAKVTPLGVFETPYKDKRLYEVHLKNTRQIAEITRTCSDSVSPL